MVVGDGINDSLALRAGAVGVAMGAQGADVALASADLALMTNDLRRLGTCIRLSRRCRRTIYVNVAIGLGFTFGLTVLAGAGVLGVEAPIIAALLHNVEHLPGPRQRRPAAAVRRDGARGGHRRGLNRGRNAVQ